MDSMAIARHENMSVMSPSGQNNFQSDILAHKNKRCWTTHKLLSQILQMGKLVSTYLNIKKIVKIIIVKRGTNRSML